MCQPEHYTHTGPINSSPDHIARSCLRPRRVGFVRCVPVSEGSGRGRGSDHVMTQLGESTLRSVEVRRGRRGAGGWARARRMGAAGRERKWRAAASGGGRAGASAAAASGGHLGGDSRVRVTDVSARRAPPAEVPRVRPAADSGVRLCACV